MTQNTLFIYRDIYFNRNLSEIIILVPIFLWAIAPETNLAEKKMCIEDFFFNESSLIYLKLIFT